MWFLLNVISLLSPHRWYRTTNAPGANPENNDGPDPDAEFPTRIFRAFMKGVKRDVRRVGLPKADIRAAFWRFVRTPIRDHDIISSAFYIDYWHDNTAKRLKVVKFGPTHDLFDIHAKAVLVDDLSENGSIIGQVDDNTLDCLETWVVTQVFSASYRKENILYNLDTARACRLRTSLFKKELMERTWHPSRLKQCLDTEEACVLGDTG